jgi:hypothetical protein
MVQFQRARPEAGVRQHALAVGHRQPVEGDAERHEHGRRVVKLAGDRG